MRGKGCGRAVLRSATTLPRVWIYRGGSVPKGELELVGLVGVDDVQLAVRAGMEVAGEKVLRGEVRWMREGMGGVQLADMQRLC